MKKLTFIIILDPNIVNFAIINRVKGAKNILVVTYWSFEDALIQTYTLPYLNIILDVIGKEGQIYLVTQEKSKAKSLQRPLSLDPRITLVPLQYYKGKWRAAFNWLIDFWLLLRLVKNKKIQVIHPWCMMGGAIGYLLAVIRKKPLILDSYEPHAESSVENGDWKPKDWKFRLLFMLERLQTKKAKQIIGTTVGMQDYALQKYGYAIPKDQFHVKPACVAMDLFKPLGEKDRAEMRARFCIGNKEVVCVYAGKLGGIYLEDEVFQWVRVAQDYWHKEGFRFVLLSNMEEAVLESKLGRFGIDEKTVIKKFVPFSEVPSILGISDFGITPVKSVNTKRYCTPIKDGEYWATGLPVVITPNISDDSNIIEKNGIGAIIESLDEQGYLKSIEKIEGILKQGPALQSKIRNIALQYRSFELAKDIYTKIYGLNPNR